MERYKLGELIDVTRGASLAGDNYATEGELVRLTLGNFDYQSNGFKQNSSKDNIFYNGEVDSSFILEEGDIITPLTEQAIGLLGSTAKIPESGKYIQSQDVALVKVKSEKLVHDFAYYLLPTASVKKQLSAGAQQTSIRHTSPDKIKDCTVYIPEPTEQQKIADFLNQIEEKIAINKKENETLEAMAKQLYDYWFIQFDFPDANGRPYKTSGGKMVWNETLKREIPEGWEVKNLPYIASFTNGLACQRFRPTGDDCGLPVIKISNMHGEKSNEKEFVKSDIPESVKVYDGDILFSWSASLEVIIWAYGIGGLNQHIFKVTEKNGYSKYFVYHKLLGYVDQFRRIAQARKTTMGHITSDHLNQSTIEIPDNEIIYKSFDKEVAPIYSRIISNSQEVIKLQGLKDFILPLLMTGQVTIE